MGLTPNTHIRVFPIGVAPTGSRYSSRIYFTLFGLTFSYIIKQTTGHHC